MPLSKELSDRLKRRGRFFKTHPKEDIYGVLAFESMIRGYLKMMSYERN